MDVRISKSIKKIILLPSDDQHRAVTLYKKKRKKKKKTSRGLRGMEKFLLRSQKGNAKFADNYIKRHKRSSRKKKDGWVRDMGYNLYRANHKRRKALKGSNVIRMFKR